MVYLVTATSDGCLRPTRVEDIGLLESDTNEVGNRRGGFICSVEAEGGRNGKFPPLFGKIHTFS